MEQKDVVIIGGGPAGLAAAVELHKQGVRNMIILEREEKLGGILRQCIHDGFGPDASATVSPVRSMRRPSSMRWRSGRSRMKPVRRCCSLRRIAA